MKKTSLTLLVVTLFSAACPINAQAETQTLHYPTQDESMFSIEAPADWKVEEIKEVGEYGTLESENGSILQFRAVECGSEEEAKAEVESISESLVKSLEEDFTDVKLGEVTELDFGGCPAFQLSGEGKDKDGHDVQFGSFTVILGPTTIAEIWAAAYPEDKAIAEATLNSFKPTGSSKAE